METAIFVKHQGNLSFTVGNGRAEVGTEWGAVEGRWMATELFLSGLGSCMLATLVDYAQSQGIDVDGARVDVAAESVPRPVRFGTVRVTYTLPAGLTQPQVDALVRAGNRCKVHQTIENHPEFTVQVNLMRDVTGA